MPYVSSVYILSYFSLSILVLSHLVPAGWHRGAPAGWAWWDAWCYLWCSMRTPGGVGAIAMRQPQAWTVGLGHPSAEMLEQNGALPAVGAMSSSTPSPSDPEVTMGWLHVPTVPWHFPPPSLLGICDTSMSSILQTRCFIICPAGKKTPLNSIPNPHPWWHRGGLTVTCQTCTDAPKHLHGCSQQLLPQWDQAGSCHSGAKAGALPTLMLQHRRERRKETVRPPPPDSALDRSRRRAENRKHGAQQNAGDVTPCARGGTGCWR